MKTILSLWLCSLTVAFGWTPTDRSFDTNVFLPIGYVFYLKTNAIAAMAGGVSGGLGTTNGASTNVGAFLKTTATTQYWSFNGAGLTNLSIPLAAVTNAGTAGYSNAGAFVLSKDGSATNLTIRSNVVIRISSLESNSIIGPTGVGITYLFRNGLVRLTNSVTLDWVDFNDGLKIGSQSSANSATISLDALTGLPKFTGLTASRATVTGSDGYLASSATTGTQVGYLSDVTGLIQAQIDGKTTSSDTAFGSSWNGVTTIAPSKNSVYDWAHTFDTDDDGKVNVLDQDVGIPITDLNGVLQTPITTSAGLASALADESGSGVVVYSTGGSLTNFITRPSTIGSVAQNILWKTGMTTNIWQIYVEDGTPGFVAYVNPSGFGVFPYGLFVGSLGSGATSYFTNNLAVGGALATIGTQTNTGAASFGSSVMVGGALNVAGGGAITGAVAHLSTFTNTGGASFASTVLVGGNETIAGTLSVTGAVNNLSTFTNTGAASLASTLLVGGAEAVAGALSVTGAVSHLSTVTNTGASSFAGAAMFGGAVNMAGALSVTNVGPTKIMGTDSGAKVVGAALSGLTWDGTTLTAIGGSQVYSNQTITIAVGSASLTTSAGAQDLSANRTWTLDTAQNIQTTATPQFARLGLGAAADATHIGLISGGTVTADTHLLDLSQTWNSSGVTFTGIKENITSTASAAGSLLMDLQVGGTTQFKVDKGGIAYVGAGGTTTPPYTFAARTDSGMRWNSPFIEILGAGTAAIGFSSGDIIIRQTVGLEWGSSGITSADLFLYRDAAATLQMGVDAATPIAQTFKGPDGSGTDKAGGQLTIGPGKPTGAGTINRVLVAIATNTTTGSTAQNYAATGAALGGDLKTDLTTAGNVGGGEDTLISYTVKGGVLGVNGTYLEFDCWGYFTNNANAKDLSIYFGATKIFDSTALVLNGIAWRGHGKVVRRTATTQEATCEFTIGGTLLGAVTTTTTTQSAPAETLASDVVFKVTGTDSGITPVDNSIVQTAQVLRWQPGQ